MVIHDMGSQCRLGTKLFSPAKGLQELVAGNAVQLQGVPSRQTILTELTATAATTRRLCSISAAAFWPRDKGLHIQFCCQHRCILLCSVLAVLNPSMLHSRL